MPYILNIETSAKICSLALASGSTILFERIERVNNSHSRDLGVFVKEVLDFVRDRALPLDAVAVSEGPGSYTGLRIGVSEAKGLCYGLGIPLIALPTLEILANWMNSSSSLPEGSLLCPMIDARRMEVYDAVYDRNMNQLRPVSADIITSDSFADLLHQQMITFFGDGAAKCKTVIDSPNALFVDEIYPLATMMPPLAEKHFNEKRFVDTAYFEPFYLKEFQATTPKNQLAVNS